VQFFNRDYYCALRFIPIFKCNGFYVKTF
jgi:hypothetical protein